MDATRVTNATEVDKGKVRRIRQQPPPLPSVASASEMGDVNYQCKVDNAPISWEALPLWTAFSLSADGSYPHVKVSKRQYCDLRTGRAYPVGGGRCYKIIF